MVFYSPLKNVFEICNSKCYTTIKCQRSTATHIAKPLKPAARANACQRVCLSQRTDRKKESTIAQQWLYVMRGFDAKLKVNEH
jgi:hypothetical protein